jgi:DNA-binding HxlR family transcriptional regulator
MAKRKEKRRYGQYCALAKALDLVGERWTILLVRELLGGPRRFKDLSRALPGAGTNLVAERLHAMEKDGLLERVLLPPPASTSAWALTPRGRELEPALVALARFGLPLLGRYESGQVLSSQWAMLGMKATFDPAAAKGVRETYELEVGPETFHVRIDDGSMEARPGPAASPALRVRGDAETILRLAAGEIALEQAARRGGVRIEGDPAAAKRCLSIFRLPARKADLR